MKNIIFLVLLCTSQVALSESISDAPLSVVNKRMNSYNQYDLKSFVSTYSNDIQIFTYPNIPLGKSGKEHLKSIFEPMFKEGKVSVEIHHQIVQGKYVINHETVTYDGKGKKYVSIYEVEDGLIKSVQFVRE